MRGLVDQIRRIDIGNRSELVVILFSRKLASGNSRANAVAGSNVLKGHIVPIRDRLVGGGLIRLVADSARYIRLVSIFGADTNVEVAASIIFRIAGIRRG